MGDKDGKAGAGSLALSANSGQSSQRLSRFVKGTSIGKPSNLDVKGLLAIFVHPLCLLLVCLPLGIASEYAGWGDICTFWLNFLGMIPLAKILGDATEELAAGLKNDMLAGLLNATFGNAVEVVIMVQTLRKGLIDVVKATLLGSVLSNLLLVLGCSFFFGGIVSNAKKWKNEDGTGSNNSRNRNSHDEKGHYTEFVGEKVQTFSVLSAMVNTSMLLLSCLSLSLVTVFYSETHVEGELDEILVPVSRTCSIIIILAYCAYIFFQLVTHRVAMSEDDHGGDDEEEAMLSVPTAIAVMFACTIVVAWTSDLLVSSLKPVVDQMHISTHFIGIVLLPIVGNACEHASAIRFAIMDKPGLSIGIAVGSSTQISLFVVPVAVLCGWAIDQPMDLNFGALNTTVMCISVVVVLSVVVDGAANWLQGYLLVSAYFCIAVLYWHLPDKLSEIS